MLLSSAAEHPPLQMSVLVALRAMMPLTDVSAKQAGQGVLSLRPVGVARGSHQC